jgi:ABC-type sugar transport system permease subunit
VSTVDAARTDRISVWRRRYHRKGYLYILPAFLLFAFMVVYPIVRSLYLSFFDYSIIEPDSMRFVAFQNYANLWTKTANHLPLWNTFYFTIIFVPPFVAFSLVLAVMLHAVKRGSVLLRTMIFTPVVVSMAVGAVMWALFYNPQFGMAQTILGAVASCLNGVWGWFGGGKLLVVPDAGMLGDPAWSMIAVAIMCYWNGVAVNVILYLVGLQRIPDELYEAAVVDGAGAWKRFFHITLPLLKPTIYLVVLLSLIGAFKIFGQPFIMTAGGPRDSTLTFVMRLYKLAFQYGKFQLGYASALAYSLAVVTFVATLFLRRLNRPVE